MGLDMYLSAKQRIKYGLDNEQYWAVKNLFGSFSTKEEEDVDISFYVSNWAHNADKGRAEQAQFHGIVDLFGLEGFVPESSPSGNVAFGGSYPNSFIEVDMHVAYWRKANQIHQWFIDNVQGGEDECNPFEASREQLDELVRICKHVLRQSDLEEGKIHTSTSYSAAGMEEYYEEGKVVAEPALAQELLPTQRGFFFGGTDYDEWYIQDLQETVDQLEKALTMPPEWTFVYRSSW